MDTPSINSKSSNLTTLWCNNGDLSLVNVHMEWEMIGKHELMNNKSWPICDHSAGGLYSGEVMVWDTSRTQDPVLAQSGMCSDTHKEAVYEVTVPYTFSLFYHEP